MRPVDHEQGERTVASAVRIGCAGWSIPGRYADRFGEGASALQRYATRLTVAEINSSFHRPHQPATYARWAAAVPPDFRFSVKVPKLISHELALRGVGAALDRFLGEALHLGPKLGGLLLQLPPALSYDARVASTFFAMLRRRTALPVAFEPRHPDWFLPEADALLQRHDISRVGVDPPRAPTGAVPAGSPAWAYWRWHGSPRIYYSAYSEATLQQRVDSLRARAAAGMPCWVIFDNTAHGFAIDNALQLQDMLGRTP